ncbi:MAG: chemotaxis protein CheD [Verrucomicrobiota bacterium]
MIDLQANLPQCHLKPGEIMICQDARIVTTVLGSCVAVTMFSARFGLAAICHAMLPEPRDSRSRDARDPDRFRYVTLAIPTMLAAFRVAGLDLSQVEVKLFGGASVMRSQQGAALGPWVGQANVEMARALLREANLQPKASNVGGHRGCKILFHTGTGRVLHKHLAEPFRP